VTAGATAGGPGAGRRPGAHPPRLAARAARAVLLLALGPVAFSACGTRSAAEQPAVAGSHAVTTLAAAPRMGGTATAGGPAGTSADPVRLRVPQLGVTAPVVPLGLDAAGGLIPPTGFAEVGWNHAGPEPGDDGVAVIAGHVDSKTGPAVFFHLRELRPGATVLVDRVDGSTATFVVDRLSEYAKNDFPDQEVYHSGSGAQLRLITCGGVFDHATGHYVDNVVVFAHLV